eukprot:363513-Chlamydomonas_euryale.AAC.7
MSRQVKQGHEQGGGRRVCVGGAGAAAGVKGGGRSRRRHRAGGRAWEGRCGWTEQARVRTDRAGTRASERWGGMAGAVGRQAFMAGAVGRQAFMAGAVGRQAFMAGAVGRQAFMAGAVGRQAFMAGAVGRQAFMETGLMQPPALSHSTCSPTPSAPHLPFPPFTHAHTNARTQEDEEQAYMEMGLMGPPPPGGGTGGAAARSHDAAADMAERQMLTSKVDPHLWKMELERVGPKLRILLNADAKDWRSNLEEVQSSSASIAKAWPESRVVLERMQAELNTSLEKLTTRERYLNEQFERLMQQYRAQKEQLQSVQGTYNKVRPRVGRVGGWEGGATSTESLSGSCSSPARKESSCSRCRARTASCSRGLGGGG